MHKVTIKRAGAWSKVPKGREGTGKLFSDRRLQENVTETFGIIFIHVKKKTVWPNVVRSLSELQ